MAQSQNTKVDLAIKATSFMGLTSYGDCMIGDRAFEFYNERNVEDYIQIPWGEIDHVSASVLFGGRKIARFAIFTKESGTFSFSTRDNKKTLRAMRTYLGDEKLLRSKSFAEIVALGAKGLVHRVAGALKRGR